MSNRTRVAQIIQRFETDGLFQAATIVLGADDCEAWVEFTFDPPRFRPRIFEGEWAWADRHPDAGELRLLRAMAGTDGVVRVIGRQGKRLFATPWL